MPTFVQAVHDCARLNAADTSVERLASWWSPASIVGCATTSSANATKAGLASYRGSESREECFKWPEVEQDRSASASEQWRPCMSFFGYL